MAAPDADTMDEWWRKASELHPEYKRHAPDYFTYNTLAVLPYQAVPKMSDIMMFTLLNDRDGRIFSNFNH